MRWTYSLGKKELRRQRKFDRYLKYWKRISYGEGDDDSGDREYEAVRLLDASLLWDVSTYTRQRR